MNNLPWVGYDTVEALAAEADPGRTIYVNSTSETLSSQPGLVHYVEIRAGCDLNGLVKILNRRQPRPRAGTSDERIDKANRRALQSLDAVARAARKAL